MGKSLPVSQIMRPLRDSAIRRWAYVPPRPATQIVTRRPNSLRTRKREAAPSIRTSLYDEPGIEHCSAKVLDIYRFLEQGDDAESLGHRENGIIIEGRHENDWDIPPSAAQRGEHAEAGQIGHEDVGDDDRRGPARVVEDLCEALEQLDAVAGLDDVVAVDPQGGGDKRAHVRVIVCHQNA